MGGVGEFPDGGDQEEELFAEDGVDLLKLGAAFRAIFAFPANWSGFRRRRLVTCVPRSRRPKFAAPVLGKSADQKECRTG